MKKVNKIRKFGLTGLLLMCASFVFAQANAGDMWLLPEYSIIKTGESFVVSLHVNTGSRSIASYACTLTYPAGLLALDTTRGVKGVNAGPDGFLTRVSDTGTGTLTISGMTAMLISPGVNLNIVLLYMKAVDLGNAKLQLTINELFDTTWKSIGQSRTGMENAIRIINPNILYGDMDDNQAVNIIDALLVAQYCVGINMTTPPPQIDVNIDGKIDIVDALLIARNSVGLIASLPLRDGLGLQNTELVPLYPGGIAPVISEPLLWNISVTLRDSLGVPLADKSVSFFYEYNTQAITQVLTNSMGVASVQIPTPFSAIMDRDIILRAMFYTNGDYMNSMTVVFVHIDASLYHTPVPVLIF